MNTLAEHRAARVLYGSETQDELTAVHEALEASGFPQAAADFLDWFAERYPVGQNRNLPGVALYTIAERFRELVRQVP